MTPNHELDQDIVNILGNLFRSRREVSISLCDLYDYLKEKHELTYKQVSLSKHIQAIIRTDENFRTRLYISEQVCYKSRMQKFITNFFTINDEDRVLSHVVHPKEFIYPEFTRKKITFEPQTRAQTAIDIELQDMSFEELEKFTKERIEQIEKNKNMIVLLDNCGQIVCYIMPTNERVKDLSRLIIHNNKYYIKNNRLKTDPYLMFTEVNSFSPTKYEVKMANE